MVVNIMGFLVYLVVESSTTTTHLFLPRGLLIYQGNQSIFPGNGHLSVAPRLGPREATRLAAARVSRSRRLGS